jgi:acetyl-CoA carboxylase carboxyl transferase subunit alpha
MVQILEFEKPIAALEAEIATLASLGSKHAEQARAKAEWRRDRTLGEIYASLTPWQKTLVARHQNRPRFLTIADTLFKEFTPLAGDRAFAEDPAIIGGPARFNGQPVMLIGQDKGHDTASRVKRNFGMAMPEGYRKAQRLVDMAGRFGLPVITVVDTPGAFPGIGAEERGQAEAIAKSTEAFLAAPVPIVSVIIGEGMSGGALGLAAANRVLMLEHAVYAVISPEGCASILWRDAGRAADAAEAMRITAADLLKLGVIDSIVPEPVGGAHRQPAEAIASIGTAVEAALESLKGKAPAALRSHRRERFLAFARAR